MAPDKFSHFVKEARVVIAHAGNGTLIHALREGKTPVVMPRRKLYGEHIDDHQVQIVGTLEQEGLIIAAMEVPDLGGAIKMALERGVNKRKRSSAILMAPPR